MPHEPDPETMPTLTPRERGAPPEHLGPYGLLETLGSGGQGVVWLAEDRRLRRRVALRLLSPPETGSEEQLLLVQREAEIASRLDHPGICGVHDAGIIEGTPFVASRFVEGRTLAALLSDARASKRGAGEVDRSVELFEKAARTIHVAHEAGIVHRDIRPGNVMVRPDGDPVILDFGIAHDPRDEAATRTSSGAWPATPTYMAPEQIQGGVRRVDRSADIWALGASLYEALTLRPPFRGATRAHLSTDVREREPEDAWRLNPAVGRDLGLVVATCLQKDPEARYATAADLAEDLRRIRSKEPILARPAPAHIRLLRWARRRPAGAGAVALAVLMIPALSLLAAFMIATSAERKEGRRLSLERAVERQLERGFFELGEGTEVAAIRAFDEALELDPENVVATAGRALALVESGQPGDALVVVDLAREPARLKRVRARALSTLGRDQEAAAVLADVPVPATPVDLFVTGLVEMSRGRDGDVGAFARAKGHFELAIGSWPRHPRRSWHLEWLHATGLSGTDAERAHAAAVTYRLWPDAPLVWLWAGFALREIDPGRARELLERFIAREPGRPAPLNHLASIAYRVGDLDRARDIARSVLAHHPELAAPHATLARVHHAKGELQEALAEYRTAYDKGGPGVILNQQIAQILLHMDRVGNAAEVTALMREADAIAPDMTVRLTLARALLLQDDVEAAIAVYRRASEVDPRRVEPWLRLHELYSSTGQFERALVAIRRAHVLAGGSQGPAAPTGEMLRKTSDLARAAAMLGRVSDHEDVVRDLDELRTLVEVAVARGEPETVLDLWASVADAPAREGAARALEAATGQAVSGPWLDRVLDLLRQDHRRIRALPDARRDAAYQRLLDEPSLAVLRDPAWLAGFDDAQRISMQSFWRSIEAAR